MQILMVSDAGLFVTLKLGKICLIVCPQVFCKPVNSRSAVMQKCNMYLTLVKNVFLSA